MNKISSGPSKVSKGASFSKDTPKFHSKLVREIENMLKHLNIDYNESVIIQMSLEEKVNMKLKLKDIILAKTLKVSKKKQKNKNASLTDSNVLEDPLELQKLLFQR